MKKIILTIGIFFFIFGMFFGQESVTEILVQGNSLTTKIEWLISNAETGKIYVIIIDRDETIPNGLNLDFDGRELTIILRGRGAMRKINLIQSSNGAVFLVRAGVTLVLDNLVTINGQSNNKEWEALVRIGNGGKLIMNNNTAVNGNTNGVGVIIDGGFFIMNGGTISANSNNLPEKEGDGGGVLIRDGGSFTMNGGTISGNNAGSGSGVGGFEKNGTFIMNGGTISGNNAYAGSAISVSGVFNMIGGSITGNIGGGVDIYDGGIFTMTGGSISGNNGCGVFISGTFNLNSPATKASVSGNNGDQIYLNSYSSNAIFRVNGLRERNY